MAKGKSKSGKQQSKRSQLVNALRTNGFSKKAVATITGLLPGRGKSKKAKKSKKK